MFELEGMKQEKPSRKARNPRRLRRGGCQQYTIDTSEVTYHDLCVEILEMLDYYLPEDPNWPTCWDGWREKAREKLSGEVVEDDIDLYLEQ